MKLPARSTSPITPHYQAILVALRLLGSRFPRFPQPKDHRCHYSSTCPA
jgi:hypothetical protein